MGYPIGTVLRIVKLSRSTYYYRKNKTDSSEVWSNAGGRPIPGYSWTFDGHRVSDEIIKQWLVVLIGGEGLFYGYLRLTHALRRQFNLNINKKKSIVFARSSISSVRSIKLSLNTPDGFPLTSHLYERTCRELNVYHELIPCKTPNKKAHIESYHSIIEEECLGHYEFKLVPIAA